ncbi:hypothetical protein [Roseibium sp. RKSG952]|uniref:hypothetical protein n=1 Tax=Roseibium sp. RKSG952 TaxID=2529384 RepID=UPI0012BC42E4|nr:hypothetical protein [Roseibium sp. RKSG952]MTH94634.1 hypothetical protein [Roseibium sp. RKSG952]
MPYYHATWVENLPSILKHGLGGSELSRSNFEGIPQGVYLALDPMVSVAVLIEALVDNPNVRDCASPADDLARIRVIVVDDARVSAEKLSVDPVIGRADVAFLHFGVIDVTSSAILTVDQLLSSAEEETATAISP